jgi:hypothetical protein
LILSTKLRDLIDLLDLGIPLRELLKRKGSMTKDLRGDGSGGIYLKTHRSHLKGRPMLVFDQILQELVVRLFDCLRVRDTSQVGDLCFSFWSDMDQLDFRKMHL